MILVLIGILAGVVSGMGIGGGTILIPALYLFFSPEQHVAQSINLLFFIPTAVAALIVHIKNKRISFPLILPIVIFGLLGAFAGASLSMALSSQVLKKCFGVFLLLMGAYEMLRKESKQKQ